MEATNLFKKKLAEIRDEYPLLENHSDLWVIGMYDVICEEQILKEFVSQTIEAGKTVKEFERRFPNTEVAFEIDNAKSFKISLNPEDFKYWDDMLKYLDSFGWYPSFIQDGFNYEKYSPKAIDKFKDYYAVITMEAKYDTQQTPDKYYYHLVPDIYLPKVELKGLTPKTQSKIAAHPGRVYLLNQDNEDEYETIANMLYDKIPSEATKDKIDQYYLLQIDANALKDKAKFYNDPNFEIGNGAVWTYQNIAPKYIKNIDTIPIYK
jgi:hypothetical protein